MSAIRLSLCTPCMGRLSDLKETIFKNLEVCKGLPVSFVLLDYNSRDGLEAWASKNLFDYIANYTILYAKTTEPTHYHHSHAKNVAHRLGSGNVLVNLDADNYVSREYIKTLIAEFSKDINSVVGGDGFNGTSGRIAISKSAFYKINGYDEALTGYGMDDIDFWYRARGIGLRNVVLDATMWEYIETVLGKKQENFDAKLPINIMIENNFRISRENLANHQFVANCGKYWGKANVRVNWREVYSL